MLYIKQKRLPLSGRTPAGQPPVWQTAPGNLGTFSMLAPIAPVQLQASDPAGLALTYRRVDGGLPEGISLGLDGTVSGTTGLVFDPVTREFEVEVRNAMGLVAKRRFALSVTTLGYVPPPVTGDGAGGQGGPSI